jgi:photosystem II stability/assembly factor-like uncharacterized protein
MNPSDALRRIRCFCLVAAVALPPAVAALAAGEAELIGPAGKCLGLAEAGDNAVLETCTQAADQRWQLPSAGFDGPIRGAGGLCLDVANAASDDRTAIQVFACHGGANQRWRLQDDGRLIGLAGKCLDMEGGGTADGTPAVLFGCHGGDNQRFRAAARNAWSRMPLLRGGAGDGGKLFAGGDGRFLYLDSPDGLARSADGGLSWSVVPSERPWSNDRSLVLADRTAADRLFATASEGLLSSADSGRSWVVAVAQGKIVRQSPADGAHFFALTDEGLYRSVDGGATFQRLAALPADGLLSTGLAIARDGGLYLSRHQGCNYHCGYGSRLYRSRDLGVTWTLLRSEAFYPGEALLPHPTAAGTLYWLHEFDLGSTVILERSDDDGATWTTTEVPGGAVMASATTDPGAPDDLWLIGGSLGIQHSRDRGASWQAEAFHPDPQVFARSLAFFDGNIVALASKLRNGDQIESLSLLGVRAAAGWTFGSPLRIGLASVSHVAAAARPGRYYASEDALWRTDDSGRTWTQVQERACPSALAADPVLPDMVYLGTPSCDFGLQQAAVYRSADAGATLEPVGPFTGATTRQIRAFPWQGGTAVVALERPYAGTTSSVVRSFDRFQTWSVVELPGPASELFVDRSGVLFATESWRGSTFHRSFDAGQTWTTREVPNAQFAAGANLLLAFDPIFGTLDLSSNAGESWRRIPSPFAWGRPQAAEIDPQGRILLIDIDGRIVASPDEGETWQWLAQDQPDTNTPELAFDPFDDRRILVATRQGPYLAHFEPAAATPAPPLALSERFEARLTWRDAVGNTGEGHGTRLTDDTGLFWLFTPERAEVAVKLLDARAIDGRFWVFVAGLTDVELDLEVRDRLTGERRTYRNPLGRLSSFGDTAAFPLGAATPSAARPPARPIGSTVANPLVNVAGRFLVVVDWTDPLGLSGDGLGFPLSHDTAAFYFFDPSNVELLVNVVDGRPLNGHYWVFFGGLSNVAYQVTITDTLTGTQRVYRNPAGSFASFGDTSAF